VRILISALWCCVLISPAAFAETQSIFGFVLGEAINLPECSYDGFAGNTKIYDAFPPRTCVQDAAPLRGYANPPRRIVFSKDEMPPIVKNWRMFILESAGRLIGVHFLTDGVDTQELVLNKLTEKYGQATKVDRLPVQNRMGARFQSIEARWKLPGLVVTFTSTLNNLDSGEVFVDLPQASALREAWKASERPRERGL